MSPQLEEAYWVPSSGVGTILEGMHNPVRMTAALVSFRERGGSGPSSKTPAYIRLTPEGLFQP